MARAFVERELRERAEWLAPEAALPAESAKGRRGMASVAPDADSGREVLAVADGAGIAAPRYGNDAADAPVCQRQFPRFMEKTNPTGGVQIDAAGLLD
jgi:hypothetical protein